MYNTYLKCFIITKYMNSKPIVKHHVHAVLGLAQSVLREGLGKIQSPAFPED